MDGLTKKQCRFVDEYLIDCNGTKAAVRAGYSPKTANEQAAKLMKNKKIKGYISEKLEELSSERIAEAQEVMEYLTSVMRGEHTEPILRLNGGGVQVVDNIGTSTKDRIRAAELIGRRYGLFKDNFEMEAIAPIIIVNDLKE